MSSPPSSADHAAGLPDEHARQEDLTRARAAATATPLEQLMAVTLPGALSDEQVMTESLRLPDLWPALNALSPTAQGKALAEVADRHGEWGLLRLDDRDAALCLRLATSDGWAVFRTEDGGVFQMLPGQRGPENSLSWFPLTQVSDVDMTCTDLLNGERGLHWVPLPGLPGPRSLYARQLALSQRKQTRTQSAARTRGYASLTSWSVSVLGFAGAVAQMHYGQSLYVGAGLGIAVAFGFNGGRQGLLALRTLRASKQPALPGRPLWTEQEISVLTQGRLAPGAQVKGAVVQVLPASGQTAGNRTLRERVLKAPEQDEQAKETADPALPRQF